jgi:hypothetical protein
MYRSSIENGDIVWILQFICNSPMHRAKLGTLFLNRLRYALQTLLQFLFLTMLWVLVKYLDIYHCLMFIRHSTDFCIPIPTALCWRDFWFQCSMFKWLNTQVSRQLHKLTSLCRFFSSQLHWEQWKRMNFVIELKTIKRIGVIKMEKIQKTWKSRPHWRSWYCPPQTSLRL